MHAIGGFADIRMAEPARLDWSAVNLDRRIIFKHYRELSTEEQADKWFGILPKEGQGENTTTYNHLQPPTTAGPGL